MDLDPGIDGIMGWDVELTFSVHKMMAVIPAWNEPILAYLLRKELPENVTKG